MKQNKNNKIGVSFYKWRAYREIDTPSWIKIRIEELKSSLFTATFIESIKLADHELIVLKKKKLQLEFLSLNAPVSNRKKKYKENREHEAV